MEEKVQKQRGRKRSIDTSKPVTIRIDNALLDYAKSQGNFSRYVNRLIRKDMEVNNKNRSV